MTGESDENYRKSTICRICEKEITSDKVIDHCNLTCNCRGPAHSKCNINVTKKQSNFIPFVVHKFSNYDCHLFIKNWLIKKWFSEI